MFVPTAWVVLRRYGARSLTLASLGVAATIAGLLLVRLDAVRAGAGLSAPPSVRLQEFAIFFLVAAMSCVGAAAFLVRRARRFPEAPFSAAVLVRGTLGFGAGFVVAGCVLLVADLIELLF